MRCRSIFAAAAALVFFVVPGLAAGQNLEITLGPVEALADMGCTDGRQVDGAVDWDTGYIGLFGIGETTYGLHVLTDGERSLMVPAAQCARVSRQSDSSVIVLSHFYRNRVSVREGYYYLMTEQGELVSAIHYLEGRSNPFVMANPDRAVIRADFESEKYIWLVKLDRVAHEARVAQ